MQRYGFLQTFSRMKSNWYIRFVKKLSFFGLIALSFLLAGCPSSNNTRYRQPLEQVQANHMDLPNPVRYYFKGIRYEISELFGRYYDDDFVLSDRYDVKTIDALNLYFSIESFSNEDAEEYKFKFEDGETLDLLNAVHDHYAITRKKSLKKANVSVKKVVPKGIGYPGVVQVISGATYENSVPNSYFFATLEVDDEYIVVQLIGKAENMGYLYDDFIDILSSISN